jgi:hypothetical protein
MFVDQLKDLKLKAETTASKLESKFKQREEADLTVYGQKESQEKQEISTLRKTLEDLQKANQEEEAALRKRKFKMETEVENWIHKYDQEMGEKQAEIDETNVNFFT